MTNICVMNTRSAHSKNGNGLHHLQEKDKLMLASKQSAIERQSRNIHPPQKLANMAHRTGPKATLSPQLSVSLPLHQHNQ